MWCFIGLGNPGAEYEGTRHNVGFDFINTLAQRWDIDVSHNSQRFLFGSGDYKDEAVLLVKPLTFMNRSGTAFTRLMQDPEFDPKQALVVYDELHLPLAQLRLRRKGSAGGHNGLQSIIGAAGTDEVPRLRIGIEGSKKNWMDFVLKPFKKYEREQIDESLIIACETVETLLEQGFDKAMNFANSQT